MLFRSPCFELFVRPAEKRFERRLIQSRARGKGRVALAGKAVPEANGFLYELGIVLIRLFRLDRSARAARAKQAPTEDGQADLKN